MNAPVNAPQELKPVSLEKTKLQLDRKRYLWAISPALPAIGIGILAGYQFAPRPLKKLFALGGPIVLHVVIPAIDTIVGKDANNPTEEDVKRLEQDPNNPVAICSQYLCLLFDGA